MGFFQLARYRNSRAQYGAILDALDFADEIHGRPVVIIARTTKGKGVSFMENMPQWHGGVPSEQQFEQALVELQEGVDQWQA